MTATDTSRDSVVADVDQLRPTFTLRPAKVTPTRWPLHLLATCSTGLIATGSAPLLLGGGESTMTAAAAASAAASAGSVTLSVRQQRRTEIGHEAHAALERVAGPVRRFRCHLWRGWFVGAPRIIRFRYHPAAVLTGQTWPHAAVTALSSVLGEGYRVSRHDERRGLLTLRRKEAARPVELHPTEGRAVELMRQLFGQSATVHAVLAGDSLATVTVRHDCGIKATFASWRERVERVVSTMLEGRWRARWDLQADRVTFELRPEIASFIKRPAPMVDPNHADFYKIPLGVDEDGNTVSWDLASSMPHFLVSGKTGKGKATAVSTPIPTPLGWTAMGDLKVGDQVFDETGQPQTVTGVYDQPAGRECYQVVFSDGATIVADADHLWWTEDRAARVARWVQRRDRQRQQRLPAEVLARLRALAAQATDTDTLTIPEAAELVGLSPSARWLHKVAGTIGGATERTRVVYNPYREQVVMQTQRVRVYAAAETAAHLRQAAAVPRLRPWSQQLQALTLDDDLTVRELSEQTGVPREMLRHVLNSADFLPSRLEKRSVTLNVSAKSVRRNFGTVRAFPKAQFLTVLADDGARLLDDQRHKHATGRVRTTSEIRRTLTTATGHLNHSIPVTRPLDLPPAELPVTPYVMGAWLGDGCSWNCELTSADPEVIHHIEGEGYQVRHYQRARDATSRARQYGVVGLAPSLRSLGVLKAAVTDGATKRVPRPYLRASIEQRRALLAGLLDTDGTVSPQGTTQFTTTIEGLADDVEELIASLGYRVSRLQGVARLNGRVTGPKWTLAFTTTDPVFKLRRKLAALRERTTRHNTDRNNCRYIREVCPVPEVPMRCITVDSPNHLFLAGRGMIPTHNTVVLRGVAMELAARRLKVWLIDPKRVELIALRGWPNVQLVATTIEQQVATIMQAWQVMEDRYQAIEAGASEEEFETLVVVLDEFAEFSRRVSQWWTRIKRTGMPSVCPIFEAFDSLVRLGRTAGIRIAIGIQRPDARFFGESAEARDNFDSRLSLGRLSPDGSRMMWGSTIGTALPGVRGRAIACTSEDRACEIQALWVPDPRRMKPDSDPDDQAVLDRLRPATATHPQLRIAIPEPELDDKGRALVWESITAAQLEEVDDSDNDAEEPELVEHESQPVEHEEQDDGHGRSATIVKFPVRRQAETADDYGPLEQVPAGKVQDGDLVLVDDRWVVVEAAEHDLFDGDMVVLAWRSVDADTDDDGTETVERTHLLPRRQLLEN